MKIGIFGGTFDPIHVGHTRVAQEFAEAFGLDRVLMMVAATPPHREPPVASPQDRLNMVHLAVKEFPVLEASGMELGREGPSYTLDTVNEVRRAGGNAFVWLALGGDAYALITTWYHPEEVLARTHVVVLTRPGYTVDLMAPLPEEVSGRYNLKENIYVHDSGATLRTLQVSPLDVSSSMIREAISRGESIQDLVSGEVLQYIQQKGLYRYQPGSMEE